MGNILEMEKKIRTLRKKMYNLIESKPQLIDPEVVKISQELDELLNLYNKIQDELKKSD